MSVIMDVLNHTFAENQKVKMLNYDNIHQLLPHCSKLIDSKYETHILAGMRSVQNILDTFKKVGACRPDPSANNRDQVDRSEQGSGLVSRGADPKGGQLR